MLDSCTFRTGLAMASLLVLAGCGKKGPLLYPDMLVPEAPRAVQVEQSGNSLQLSFGLPTRDQAGRVLKTPFVVQVQRRELEAGERGACGSCPQDYQPIVRIDPEFPAPAMRFGERVVLVDSDVRLNKHYQYRLVAISGGENGGGGAAESLRSQLCAAPAPPAVRAKAVHGGVILLEMDGVVPDNAELIGYALYRASGEEAFSFQPLVTTLGTARYEDLSVQRDVSYRYAARMVVRRGDDLVMSSELSPVVTVRVSDDTN